jgi:ADP-heptose:LPS heptosyltransferase
MGDELMAAGQARLLHQLNPQPVVIVDARGMARRHELWHGVPYIIQRPRGAPHHRLVNAPGVRPYIAAKTPERWKWKPFKPTPAEVIFTPDELAFAEPYRDMVMIEPNGKAIGHTNKQWVPERWGELLDVMVPSMRLDDSPFVQCGPPGTHFLDEVVRHVTTPTFRHALAVLSVCRAFVGTEGGLMHGAAAVGTPAVILWSEFISPEITGYAQHRNIRHAGKPCGMRRDCPTCRASMAAISVDEVVCNLREIL